MLAGLLAGRAFMTGKATGKLPAMSREAIRNICIVIALVLVVAVPAGGGALAGLVLLVLRILLIAAFIYFGYIMWRENKHKTAWLPPGSARSSTQRLPSGGAAARQFFWPAWNASRRSCSWPWSAGLGYLIWRILDDSRRYY